jgi:hypothetical protein
MNYIIDFSNDPNSLSPEQITQLNSALTDAVKNKISNIENKYNVKLKFPKNICFGKKNNNQKLPLPMIPTLITPTDISIFVPFNVIMENTNSENTIDGLSSCMRIVNSIKKDLELYSSGKKTKEQVDSTFIEWVDPVTEKEEVVYESEIDEAYEKKFGNKALIKKLIQELEYSDKLL